MKGKDVFRFRSNRRLTIHRCLQREKERRRKLHEQISHTFFFASRLFFHLCLDSRTIPTEVLLSLTNIVRYYVFRRKKGRKPGTAQNQPMSSVHVCHPAASFPLFFSPYSHKLDKTFAARKVWERNESFLSPSIRLPVTSRR